MRVLLSLAAVLAVAFTLNMAGAKPASACYGWSCGGGVAISVPAPNPIPIRPMRRLRPCWGFGACGGHIVVTAPCCAAAYAPAPCGVRCGAVYAPAPCGIRCRRAYVPAGPTYYGYVPRHYSRYTAGLFGDGDGFWRRDCWYDAFGRRFCS